MCKQEKLYDDTLSTGAEAESACELFEIRLNDQLDLRNCLDGLSDDEHVVSCICCRSLLLKYEQLGDLIKPVLESKSADLDEATYLKPTVVNRNAKSNSATGVLTNRVMGWSAVLAVLFLIWGKPVREFDVSVNRLDVTSTVALTHGETHLELPGQDLLAGQLASVSMGNVNFSNFPSIEKLGLGQYWQHASRLPGIEPWQHSVSFAIGWINHGEPSGGQSPLLDSTGIVNPKSELDCPDIGQQRPAHFALRRLA